MSPANLRLEAATEDSNKPYLENGTIIRDNQERSHYRRPTSSAHYPTDNYESKSEENFGMISGETNSVQQETVKEIVGTPTSNSGGNEYGVEPSGYPAMQSWKLCIETNDAKDGDENHQGHGTNGASTLPEESESSTKEAESRKSTQCLKRKRASVDEADREVSGRACTNLPLYTLTQEDLNFDQPIHIDVNPYLPADDNNKFTNQASYDTYFPEDRNGHSDEVHRCKRLPGPLEWYHSVLPWQIPEANVANIIRAPTNGMHSIQEYALDDFTHDVPTHCSDAIWPLCDDPFFVADNTISTSPTNMSFPHSEITSERNYEVDDPLDQMYPWTKLIPDLWHQHCERNVNDASLNFNWWAYPIPDHLSLEQSNVNGSGRLLQTRQSSTNSNTSMVSYTSCNTFDSSVQSPFTQLSFNDTCLDYSTILANDHSPMVSHEPSEISGTHLIEQSNLPGTPFRNVPDTDCMGNHWEGNDILRKTKSLSPLSTISSVSISTDESQEDRSSPAQKTILQCKICCKHITAVKERNAHQNLSRHIKTIHSKRLLECRNDDCHTTFTRSDNRAFHERTAHGLERPRKVKKRDTVRKSRKHKRSVVQ